VMPVCLVSCSLWRSHPLNAPSGTITSPNYPNLYPHSRLCHWEVVAMPGRRVTLTINDLRLEGSGTSCLYDYVEVRTSCDTAAPLMGTFCGSELPPKLRSSSNHLYLVFRTDSSVSGEVFYVMLKLSNYELCSHVCVDLSHSFKYLLNLVKVGASLTKVRRPQTTVPLYTTFK
uniref:CUB domain-containing protein n=1 Tax=Periophthalmus magnuspinnatus TaxID=409849 RepID=A0A3B4B224_9GOBI